MKKRIIISVLLQLCLTALSLLAAYDLDSLARGQGRGHSLSFGDALAALSNRKVLVLFLLFTGLSALVVGCMALGQSYIHYRSDMQRLTPDLETPIEAGQGQYGTSRWLRRGELSKVFTMVQVDQDAERLRQLIREADRERMTELK